MSILSKVLFKPAVLVAPLVLSLVAVSTPAAAYSFGYQYGTWPYPQSSSTSSSDPLINEYVANDTLRYPGERFLGHYVLSTTGSLSGSARSISLKFNDVTLFQCNAKTTCPGNNDNISLEVTIMRTDVNQKVGTVQSTNNTGTATVTYIDRQNGGSTAVTTVYTTHLTGLDWSNTSYNLNLYGNSTGVNAANGDVTAEWAAFELLFSGY